MDNPKHSPDTPAIRFVEKPASTFSTVMNGVFNGGTLGGAAFVVPEVAISFFKPEAKFSHNYFRGTVIATVLGASIGTYFSLKEAKQVNDYRAALAKDIETLHAQVDGIDPRVQR